MADSHEESQGCGPHSLSLAIFQLEQTLFLSISISSIALDPSPNCEF